MFLLFVIVTILSIAVVTAIHIIFFYRRKKLSDNALRESREMFMQFIDNAPGITHIKDSGGHYAFVNGNFLKAFNVSLADVIGKTVFDIHPPEVARRLAENDKKVLADKVLVEFEEVVLLEGENHVFISHKFPIVREGKPSLVGSISVDITKRKNMETLIRSNEEKYRILFENSPVGILTLDTEGNILDINSKAVDILGSPSVEATKAINLLTFKLLVDAGISSFLKECFSLKQGMSKEFEYTTKWGKHIYVIFSLVPNKYVSETIVNWQLIIQDISARRIFEKELEKNLTFIQALIDTIPNPVFYKDTELRYIGCNKAFTEYYGLEKADIIGKSVYDIAPSDLAEVYSKADKELLEKGAIQIYESSIQNVKSGVRYNVIFHKAVFYNLDGAVGGLIGSVLDITGRKKAEVEKDKMQAQLLQAGKLAALGKMAAGIAHELNNPMTVIMGNTQFLVSREDVPEGLKQVFKEIEQASQRCKNIVADLLEFSRLKETDFISISIHNLLDDVLRLVSYQSEFKLVKIIKNYECATPEIYCNISKIQQVFINLITNAAQAMPKGGELRISTTCDTHSQSIAVSVTDTGMGIAHEDIAKLFDPFYTTKPKGTGLGLPISMNIVQLHGGFITVDSPGPGKGSTFTVVLPVKPSNVK
jgi:PAS domain S-box-containing protein